MVSGKGGAGKTTVAVNLATLAGEIYGGKYLGVFLYDCDVEEPNSFLYTKPVGVSEEAVYIKIPELIESKCDYCGICSKKCRFNAILVSEHVYLIFDDLCHGCGACIELCPRDALIEKKHRIGVIKQGRYNGISLVWGVLEVGKVLATPIIKKMKERMHDNYLYFIDSPPGLSCPVVEVITGVDYIVTVAEPTPFGLYDFKLLYKLLSRYDIPFGLVVNKYTSRDSELEIYAKNNSIDIIGMIKFEREYGIALSRGHLLWDRFPELRDIFEDILRTILKK